MTYARHLLFTSLLLMACGAEKGKDRPGMGTQDEPLYLLLTQVYGTEDRTVYMLPMNTLDPSDLSLDDARVPERGQLQRGGRSCARVRWSQAHHHRVRDRRRVHVARGKVSELCRLSVG